MVRKYSAKATILITLLLLWVGAAVALAQNREMVVTLLNTDSEAFPEVAVFMAVTDENGPVEGLTATDVQFFEDEMAAAGAGLTVEPTTLEGLRVVLVLDVSLEVSDLNQVKTAATSLINTLQPADKMAIMTFANDVQLGYNFTNNTSELQGVLEGLTRQGDQTVLYRAISEAALMANQEAGGRKAIVIITDSRDNSGNVAVESVVDELEQLNLPVYLIGFSDKAQLPPALANQIPLTGGQYFTFPTANQIQATLPEIEAQLRQGYKVTFPSSLKADGAEHTVSLVVTQPGQTGAAEGQFEAIPRALTIALPAIQPDQALSGLVQLVPEITPAGEISVVSYALDGQLLAEVTTAPYALEWDTATTAAGAHTLTAVVVDQVGNSGQTEINLTVLGPTKVEISTPKNEIAVGEQVVIRSNIETSAPLERVELLLDGVLVDSDETPPYTFAFDSSQYPVGAYNITVRVKDTLGQVAEDSLDLKLVPPPPPQPTWFQRLFNDPRFKNGVVIVAALLAVIALNLIALLILRRIFNFLRQRSYRSCRVEIANLGNIHTPYILRATDLANDLKFQFSANGDKLPQPTIFEVIETSQRSRTEPLAVGAVPAIYSAQPLGQYYEPQPTNPTPPPSRPSPAVKQSNEPSRASQTFEKAQNTEAQTQGCLSTITDLLDVTASMLPGSLGSPLLRLSQRIYGSQMAVSRAKMAPMQAVRSASYIKSQVTPSTSSFGSRQNRFSSSTSSQPLTSPQPVYPSGGVMSPQPISGSGYGYSPQPAATDPAKMATNEGRRPKVLQEWVQTPAIDPGEALMVDMLIMPDKPFRRQAYDFTVTSKPFEPEQGDSDVAEQGVVHIRGVHWLWRFLPVSLVVGVMILAVAAIISLAMWRLTGVNVLETWL